MVKFSHICQTLGENQFSHLPVLSLLVFHTYITSHIFLLVLSRMSRTDANFHVMLCFHTRCEALSNYYVPEASFEQKKVLALFLLDLRFSARIEVHQKKRSKRSHHHACPTPTAPHHSFFFIARSSSTISSSPRAVYSDLSTERLFSQQSQSNDIVV